MAKRNYPTTDAQRAASRINGRKVGKLPKTQTQLAASRRNGSGNVAKAQKVSHGLPRSEKQKQQFAKLCHLPRTPAQKKADLENIRGVRVFADTIIKHHNDLCHGALRPDDITYMTHSEHCKLHMKIRIKNGNPPWMAKKEEIVE